MSTEFSPPNDATKETVIKVWIGIFSVAAFYLVVLGLIEWHPGHRAFFGAGSPSLSDLGNYGSYLQGTVASLWSLAAFFIIFVAFLAQKQQLLRQDIELEEHRNQFKLQQHSIDRQNFENSFFQLLGVHNQIVSGLETISHNSHKMAEARLCFISWYYFFRDVETGEKRDKQGNIVEPAATSSAQKYMRFYSSFQGDLGHYFRNLYHVIKFVKESEALKHDDPAIDYKNRRRYTSLVRATLSQYELVLLFYDGLSPLGEKFKPLIEDFGLLENLDRSFLLHTKDEKFYAENAFK